MQLNLDTIKNTPPWQWPEEASSVFLKVLRDSDADDSERITAAELAGDLVAINDDLAEELLSIAANENEPVELRYTATISLGPVLEEADTGEFEDPDEIPITEETFHRINETLHKLYMGGDVPQKIRRAALEASVQSPQDWHAGAIRAAYASGDENWRLTAVFAMRFIPGFDSDILAALNSPDPHIRYNAVCAAGNWGLDEAWPHIAGLLESQDADKHELIAAIEASIEIRPEEAGMFLVDLTDHDDEDVVDAAHENMAMAEAMIEAEELDEEDID